MNRVLILGATGFIGQAMYKELRSYFDVYGTYHTATQYAEDNNILFSYTCETDAIYTLLTQIEPTVIISCFKGDSEKKHSAHEEIATYVATTANTKLVYISSSIVFEANTDYPSYENDLLKPLSEKAKSFASIEKLLTKLPKEKVAIVRLPCVLDVLAPPIIQLKESIKNKVPFEVYPNRIISVTTASKMSQQVHYIINKGLFGIFHLASNDVIHHEELFSEIAKAFSDALPIFKRVFTQNEDYYQAILPKHNVLPSNYAIAVNDVIASCNLKEEIETIKQKL